MITGWLETRRALPTSFARHRLSIADRCSIAIGCALVAMSLAQLWTELTYDEAVYLRLARTIAEGGLPLRRAYDDFTQFRLFANSPPLVLYVASLSQRIFPGDELSARLVQFAVFVLPTYVIVWWVARVKFGAWAAFASLVALLSTRTYVRATTHVLLNIPLGLLACIALLAFYHASSSPVRRRSWMAVGAVTLALAVWTKYQAVCVAAAIMTYVVYTVVTRGYVGVRSMFLPLASMVVAGGTAVITLVWFFWANGGPETLTSTLTLNAARINPASMSMPQIIAAAIETARECESTLGGTVLVLGICALCAERRHRGLLVLLASFVGATIAFNVTLFRLPGAGSSYLHSTVPALALLAGPGAVRIVTLATTTATRTLLAAAAITIQLAGSLSVPHEMRRSNGSRVAAAYIAENSEPTAGVLAETVAVEFYADRPVRAVSFTFPRQLVLQSLEGTSGDNISYVVVDAAVAPKNLDAVRQQWDRLLAEHFELVPAGAPGLKVYRRRALRHIDHGS
jgi:4-amino-4-deoxy-L-arabinose transferase-like glycosyltransferase